MTVLLTAVCLAATSAWSMPSYEDVLLVVNPNSSESMEIGNYFKTKRNLPAANVCSINVKAGSDGARMGNTEKWAALSTIKNHMAKNNLTDKINYIVLTRGMPVYANTGIKGTDYNGNPIDLYHLFDVFLMYQLSSAATDSKIGNIFYNNPYFYYNNDLDKLTKKFSKTKFGYYIVGRLDGLGTVTIKNFIDSTGAPAYESYKKQANGKMKLLTITPYYSQDMADEINRRGNIEVVSPNPVPKDTWDGTKTTLVDIKTPAEGQITTTFDKVAKDAMFCYLNDVSWSSFFPWPQGNSYYADGDFVGDYPFIYRGATFLPGSIIMIYRSYPSMVESRGSAGGVRKINISSKAITSYVKLDASDIKFRHQTCVEYDPVNNQLWAGTGKNQLDVVMYFDSRCSVEAHRETMRNYGGGIVIYDSVGNIVKWINANDAGSPLKNNRVTKLVYDKNSKYMWVAHYKGIQYYDMTNKTWNEVKLQDAACDYAAAVGIYLDPFDSDKVYFSFYYDPSTAWPYPNTVASQITGADTSIFEYSKKNKTVTPYVIDATNNKGLSPQMGKTSANTLWVSKGKTLYRYDLTAKAMVEKIDMSTVIPEMLTPPANYDSKNPVSIDVIRNIISIPSSKVVLVPVGCNITYTKDLIEGTPSKYQKKNYIVRVTEAAVPPSMTDTVNIAKMNSVSGDLIPAFKVMDVTADPSTSGKTVFMTLTSPPAVICSTDGTGKSWSVFSTDWSLSRAYGLALDGKGYLYAANGYEIGQNIAADFQAFGVCAFGGGKTHDGMTYGESNTWAPSPHSPGYPYCAGGGSWDGSGYRGASQMEQMMLMLLDGFYMGEARLAVFLAYPETGGGGHIGHMTVFEPKSAPFAPRVNEAMMPATPQVTAKTTIEIPILSPGLPWHMNDLIMSTVNKSTVQITDDTGAVFTPTKYEFVKPTKSDEAGKVTGTGKLVISGNFTGIYYTVKLICGVNGIKNIKGASLTNTRPAEFKDDITFIFGNGIDISKGTYQPPPAITGPVAMGTSTKCDLIVDKVWLDGVPVAGQSLPVKFRIKNIGKGKANVSSIVANVYWNNILVGSVSHADLAAQAAVELSFLLDKQYVFAGRQNVIMVKADGTDKIVEVRETNNTGSVPFSIK